jgi:hypothetical protein
MPSPYSREENLSPNKIIKKIVQKSCLRSLVEEAILLEREAILCMIHDMREEISSGKRRHFSTDRLIAKIENRGFREMEGDTHYGEGYEMFPVIE